MDSLQKTESLSLVPADVSAGALQSALAGDLSKLREDDRLKFYGALCNHTGLNPLSKPFDWLTFQGKLTLYANKGCAEQLRKINGASVEILERKIEYGCFIVRVAITDKSGRRDEALAALPFAEKNPTEAALAMMKCETKAKRRATLSFYGLSMLLERETDDEISATPHTEIVTGAETAQDRADKLNKALTDGQKSKAVDVEVVEPLKESKTEVQQPEPDGFEFTTENPQPVQPAQPPELSPEEKRVRELELVLSENKNCLPYLLAQGKLLKVDGRVNGLETLDKVYAEKILLNSKRFLAAVDAWSKGQNK